MSSWFGFAAVLPERMVLTGLQEPLKTWKTNMSCSLSLFQSCGWTSVCRDAALEKVLLTVAPALSVDLVTIL